MLKQVFQMICNNHEGEDQRLVIQIFQTFMPVIKNVINNSFECFKTQKNQSPDLMSLKDIINQNLNFDYQISSSVQVNQKMFNTRINQRKIQIHQYQTPISKIHSPKSDHSKEQEKVIRLSRNLNQAEKKNHQKYQKKKFAYSPIKDQKQFSQIKMMLSKILNQVTPSGNRKDQKEIQTQTEDQSFLFVKKKQKSHKDQQEGDIKQKLIILSDLDLNEKYEIQKSLDYSFREEKEEKKRNLKEEYVRYFHLLNQLKNSEQKQNPQIKLNELNSIFQKFNDQKQRIQILEQQKSMLQKLVIEIAKQTSKVIFQLNTHFIDYFLSKMESYQQLSNQTVFLNRVFKEMDQIRKNIKVQGNILCDKFKKNSLCVNQMILFKQKFISRWVQKGKKIKYLLMQMKNEQQNVSGQLTLISDVY